MKKPKRDFIKWLRYYTVSRSDYDECMKKTFTDNLVGLRRANSMFVVVALCFTFFPAFVEQDFMKVCIYLLAAAIALFIAVHSDRIHKEHKNKAAVSDRRIYGLMVAYYINAMAFGMALGVWLNAENLAVNFMAFLVCALFLFVNPPMFNLALTLCAAGVFGVSTVVMKESDLWVFDLANVAIAAIISCIFTWYVGVNKMRAILNAMKLEEERNNYFDQSTTCDLTQMKNVRDFNQVFKRYLSHYRETDKYLCLAIIDIDHYKLFNDTYGHDIGNECLRKVGGALNGLREKAGVYAARIGGEEFALLWFDDDKENVNNIIEMMRRRVADLNIPHETSEVSDKLTVSAGVYIAVCGGSPESAEIFKAADSACYEAKKLGRNRVVVRGEDTEEYEVV